MNLIMGGKIITGLVINLIVCTTFIPYHLFQISRLLGELDGLKKEIYNKSIQDELTQVYNRRHFMDIIRGLKTEQEEIPSLTSILLIDMDNFKEINDKHGHLIGDEVLKMMTAQCTSLLRPTDIFARYGGDEFICLLPQTSHEQAHEIANRIQMHINQLSIRSHKNNVKFTVSIGIITSKAAQKWDDLIALADQRLYKAKKLGKNQII
ncbi:MAG: GGDEF domain-containing protein [Anaerolineales bacterium]